MRKQKRSRTGGFDAVKEGLRCCYCFSIAIPGLYDMEQKSSDRWFGNIWRLPACVKGGYGFCWMSGMWRMYCRRMQHVMVLRGRIYLKRTLFRNQELHKWQGSPAERKAVPILPLPIARRLSLNRSLCKNQPQETALLRLIRIRSAATAHFRTKGSRDAGLFIPPKPG